jgi:hypothetical protein
MKMAAFWFDIQTQKWPDIEIFGLLGVQVSGVDCIGQTGFAMDWVKFF